MHRRTARPRSLTLLAIPLIIWLRLRRMRRSDRAQDFWFEPEGDHFIYHPFGRFGGAFLVSPETRTAIRARLSQFTRIAGIVLLVVILGPLCLRSLDEALYWQYRPWFLAMRLGMIVALLGGGLIWRLVAIRPLYAGAAAAPRRIAMGDVRARQAAARSWWGAAIGFAVTGGLAAFFLSRARGDRRDTDGDLWRRARSAGAAQRARADRQVPAAGRLSRAASPPLAARLTGWRPALDRRG